MLVSGFEDFGDWAFVNFVAMKATLVVAVMTFFSTIGEYFYVIINLKRRSS